MLPKEWKPIVRVGTPNVKPSRDDEDIITVQLNTSPRAEPEWFEYFAQFTKANGVPVTFNSHGLDGDGIWAQIPIDGLERLVADVDQGIENANELYEQNALPVAKAAAERAAEEKAAKAAKKAALDARVAKLARPEARDL